MPERQQKSFATAASNQRLKGNNGYLYPTCPTCQAQPGYPCTPVARARTTRRYLTQAHAARREARRQQNG